MTSTLARDPLAYQPSPLAGVHPMEVLAIVEVWQPFGVATIYRFSAAFEPVEALSIARFGSA